MAIFSTPDDFKTHKEYVVMLKQAMALVKPGPGKKFLYYAAHKFTDKKDKLPLVLVDFDLNCKTILNTRGTKLTANGMVKLNDDQLLDFDAETGKLKRVRIKAYFKGMGPGLKPVFVPDGEVDDEAPLEGGSESEGGEQSGTESGEGQSPPRPTQPLPTPPQKPVTESAPPSRPLPQTPTQPKKEEETQPSTGPSKMDRQVEFAEKQFALRQRIEEMRKQPSPKEHDDVKERTLAMASGLVTKGKFADTTKLLDQLVLRLKTLPNRPPPPKLPTLPPTPQSSQPTTPPPVTQTTPPPTTGPKPKLPDLPPTPQEPKKVKPRTISTFFNSSSNWKAAKKTSSEGVAALQAAILNACDPELKKLVEPKVKSLTSIVDLMDEGIVIKVQEAANESDEERLPQRFKAVVDMANGQLSAIRNHQLGPAADKNAFGSFSICGPMEAVLTKMTVDFAS